MGSRTNKFNKKRQKSYTRLFDRTNKIRHCKTFCIRLRLHSKIKPQNKKILKFRCAVACADAVAVVW
ncbi:hypothetical protein M0804_009021 [Polistes exclamans]|nr:hypothetical protein M0804_009021 [Polistes exclamans]